MSRRRRKMGRPGMKRRRNSFDRSSREDQRRAMSDPENMAMRSRAALNEFRSGAVLTREEAFKRLCDIAFDKTARFVLFKDAMRQILEGLGNADEIRPTHTVTTEINHRRLLIREPDELVPESVIKGILKWDIAKWVGQAYARKVGTMYLGQVRRELGPERNGGQYWDDAWWSKIVRAWGRRRGIKPKTKVYRYSMVSQPLGVFGEDDESSMWICFLFPWAARSEPDGARLQVDPDGDREDRSDMMTDYHDPGGVLVPVDLGAEMAVEIRNEMGKHGWPFQPTARGRELLQSGAIAPKERTEFKSPGSSGPSIPRPLRGDVLIHHSPEHGTIISGETRRIRDQIKLLNRNNGLSKGRFRWSKDLLAWYLPSTRELDASPLDAMRAALYFSSERAVSVEIERPDGGRSLVNPPDIDNPMGRVEEITEGASLPEIPSAPPEPMRSLSYHGADVGGLSSRIPSARERITAPPEAPPLNDPPPPPPRPADGSVSRENIEAWRLHMENRRVFFREPKHPKMQRTGVVVWVMGGEDSQNRYGDGRGALLTIREDYSLKFFTVPFDQVQLHPSELSPPQRPLTDEPSTLKAWSAYAYNKKVASISTPEAERTAHGKAHFVDQIAQGIGGPHENYRELVHLLIDMQSGGNKGHVWMNGRDAILATPKPKVTRRGRLRPPKGSFAQPHQRWARESSAASSARRGPRMRGPDNYFGRTTSFDPSAVLDRAVKLASKCFAKMPDDARRAARFLYLRQAVRELLEQEGIQDRGRLNGLEDRLTIEDAKIKPDASGAPRRLDERHVGVWLGHNGMRQGTEVLARKHPHENGWISTLRTPQGEYEYRGSSKTDALRKILEDSRPWRDWWAKRLEDEYGISRGSSGWKPWHSSCLPQSRWGAELEAEKASLSGQASEFANKAGEEQAQAYLNDLWAFVVESRALKSLLNEPFDNSKMKGLKDHLGSGFTAEKETEAGNVFVTIRTTGQYRHKWTGSAGQNVKDAINKVKRAVEGAANMTDESWRDQGDGVVSGSPSGLQHAAFLEGHYGIVAPGRIAVPAELQGSYSRVAERLLEPTPPPPMTDHEAGIREAAADRQVIVKALESGGPADKAAAVSESWVAFGEAHPDRVWSLAGESSLKSPIRAQGVRLDPSTGRHQLVIAVKAPESVTKRLEKRWGVPAVLPRCCQGLDDSWEVFELPQETARWDALSSQLLDPSRWGEIGARKASKPKGAGRAGRAPKWMGESMRTPKNDALARVSRRRAEKALKKAQESLARSKSEATKEQAAKEIEAARAVIDAYLQYMDPLVTPIDEASYKSSRKGARPSKAAMYRPHLPSGSRPEVPRGSDRAVISAMAQALALGVLVDYESWKRMKAPTTPIPDPGKEERDELRDCTIRRYACPTKRNPKPEDFPAWVRSQCHGLMYDSEGRSYKYVIDVLPVPHAITSHDDQARPVEMFPQELQARDRAAAESRLEVAEIARKLDPERLLQVGPSPAEGCPVVWESALPGGGRGDVVLAGNGRTMAFRAAPAEIQARYFDIVHHLTGRRGLLVRRLVNANMAQARAFAAASQRSASAAETPLEQARALMRSITIRGFEDLPKIDTAPLRGQPMTSESKRLMAFEEHNKSLRAIAFPEGEPALWRARAERYALLFIALLPEQAKQSIEALGPHGEAVLVGMSPYLAEVSSAAARGELAVLDNSDQRHDISDLADPAPSISKIAPILTRYRGWTASRVFADLSSRLMTASLPGFEEADPIHGLSFTDIVWLMSFVRAASSANPEARGADLGYRLVKAVDEERSEAQMAMFGYERETRRFLNRVVASRKGADSMAAKEAEAILEVIEASERGRRNPILMAGNPDEQLGMFGHEPHTEPAGPAFERVTSGARIKRAWDEDFRRYNARCRRCNLAGSALLRKVKLDMRPFNAFEDNAGDIISPFGMDYYAAEWTCPGCGAPKAAAPVQGVFKAHIQCDARCESATGHKCECSCGGMNHGAAHG